MATYPQRTTDISVIETGLATSVRTYIIMPPTIYGVGSGLFNTMSIQIPTLMRTAIAKGRAEVVGAGAARWSHVHIADLAPLYGVLLRGVLRGEERERDSGRGGGLVYGPRGIYFAETGEHTWLELAEGVARAGFELGVLQEPVPVSITLQQSADQWGKGSLEYGELGWCSS
jgi:nucleoside-diphosphate-sugar epimerase